MSDAKSRRRFLLDMLCLGGVLCAASQIRPFFNQFLEDQHPEASPSAQPTAPVPVTEAYPSDSDLHQVRQPPGPVTKAYPSDGDAIESTCAYPSDSDAHAPRPSRPTRPPKSSLRGPLWTRWS